MAIYLLEPCYVTFYLFAIPLELQSRWLWENALYTSFLSIEELQNESLVRFTATYRRFGYCLIVSWEVGHLFFSSTVKIQTIFDSHLFFVDFFPPVTLIKIPISLLELVSRSYPDQHFLNLALETVPRLCWTGCVGQSWNVLFRYWVMYCGAFQTWVYLAPQRFPGPDLSPSSLPLKRLFLRHHSLPQSPQIHRGHFKPYWCST